MKKLTLSVAALTIAMMSYGQTQCNELTTDSVQCKNTTKAKTITAVCSGITKKGNNCKNKTKNTNGKCHLHGGKKD